MTNANTQAWKDSLAVVPSKPFLVRNPNTGCTHPSRNERGMCLDCCMETGVPGVEYQVRTLREQAAMKFRLATRCLSTSNNPFKRGSAPWKQTSERMRGFAAGLLAEYHVIRAQERA